MYATLSRLRCTQGHGTLPGPSSRSFPASINPQQTPSCRRLNIPTPRSMRPPSPLVVASKMQPFHPKPLDIPSVHVHDQRAFLMQDAREFVFVRAFNLPRSGSISAERLVSVDAKSSYAVAGWSAAVCRVSSRPIGPSANRRTTRIIPKSGEDVGSHNPRSPA